MSGVPSVNSVNHVVVDGETPPRRRPDAAVSWQREMAGAVRSPTELLARLQLTPADVPDADLSSDTTFSTLVPDSFVRRMRCNEARDPLLMQVLPLRSERQSVTGFVTDAVDDDAAHRAPGLLQKYGGRALLLAAGTCAVHCRYCFRREYPYGEEPRRPDDWAPALDTIRADPTLSEIIFSGGDPWMLSDERLSTMCRLVDQIPHVERIRFHTRMPIVLPSRVTVELLNLLKSLRSQPIVVVHANHGNEIADDCEDALRALVRAGLPVLNQAVLLRGVNDSTDALVELSRRLVNVGVIPYYLHQLDRASGTAQFEVDAGRGCEFVEELTQRLPGYAVPQFVQEIPGEPSKTRLL